VINDDCCECNGVYNRQQNSTCYSSWPMSLFQSKLKVVSLT
jgi:hypothetical protein